VNFSTSTPRRWDFLVREVENLSRISSANEKALGLVGHKFIGYYCGPSGSSERISSISFRETVALERGNGPTAENQPLR